MVRRSSSPRGLSREPGCLRSSANAGSPVLGTQRMHTGVDYAARTGTPVSVTGAGTVVFAGTMRGYGRTIDVDHGGGVLTRYAHLSRFAAGIAPGVELNAGARIGDVGATGLVSGPNLHYEVRIDGKPTDPIKKTPATPNSDRQTD